MNILLSFISWRVVNYLQNHTLSIKYNYLLAFIFKLHIIFNIIYKLSVIIHKLIIICKGYNSPYKQGSVAPLHSYKYQVSLIPQHTRANIPVHLSFVLQVPPPFLLTKTSFKTNMRSPGAHFDHIHPNVCQLQSLISTLFYPLT